MEKSKVYFTDFRCKVGTRVYNGNEYNEIKKFYPKDEIVQAQTPNYNPGQF